MKILANDGLSQAGVDMLEKAGHKVIQTKVAQERLAKYINDNDIDVILVRSATKIRKDLIDACPNLKIIGRGGVGLDNIDVDHAVSKGIKVINTPAASSDSVAELVMAHALSGFRFLHLANRQMPLEGDSKFKELKKSYAKGTELKGKTMGIVGIGRIGQATAKRAIGMGMNVVVHDKFTDEVDVRLDFFDGQHLDFHLKSIDFDDLLSKSDIITFHVPSQKDYILGAKEIEKMKDGATVINTARGGVIEEKAIVEALESGKLSFAAIDVFENEPTPEIKLLMQSKLSLSPHIGGATTQAQDRIGIELAEQIIQLSQ
ncbi:D-2-hydroxyacid dehydrogenase [Flavobacterium sp. CS20]|uniref:D-2-hydroxyacid dehydrogenase n=1 Tax=Flavobacterium sp. CS20 TaxID=2775246 RepID=UPI001B3A11E3|nr:D-2-hydroxyacid dehydrogenase [Flavobacterium sp. CS20]QTY28129.1 D-2-hydroxyacid dehydrogenase [Flavobacterium sp. CS20]